MDGGPAWCLRIPNRTDHGCWPRLQYASDLRKRPLVEVGGEQQPDLEKPPQDFRLLRDSLRELLLHELLHGSACQRAGDRPFPGRHDDAFVERCFHFFKRQMEVARPKLILILGLKPVQVLSKHVFHIDVPETLHACEGIDAAVRLAHGDVRIAAITQPSMYNRNVGGRRYAGLTGKDAEIAMVKAAINCAGLPAHRHP